MPEHIERRSGRESRVGEGAGWRSALAVAIGLVALGCGGRGGAAPDDRGVETREAVSPVSAPSASERAQAHAAASDDASPRSIEPGPAPVVEDASEQTRPAAQPDAARAARVDADAEDEARADDEPRTRRADAFLSYADAPILEALSSEPIEEVERGRGGRSLGFRLTLEDGTRAYFKPDQSFNGMSWNAELAAHHLDRALGLGRVAPVVGRTFDWSELEPTAAPDRRVDEIRVDDEGMVRGAVIWWVPERLVPLELPDGWEAWLRQDGRAPAVTPFQRPGEYRRAVARAQRAAAETGDDAPSPHREAPDAPADPERAAELSDLIVFDYLTQNLDRWGTNNTNVRTVGADGPLMYLDNAAAFTLGRPRIGLMDRRLEQAERFRRSTVAAVRALDVDAFAAQLADDPAGPLLSARQIQNLRVRRRHLLEHVDALVEAHGEDAVLPWD